MMKAFKVIPASKEGVFEFGGDIAYIEDWPKNSEGQDLLLMFTINCKAIRKITSREDLPANGFIQVFSTYDPDEYFLDLITYDQVKHRKEIPSYTLVIYSDGKKFCKSPRISIPLLHADLVVKEIGDDEICIASLFSNEAPRGAVIPDDIEKDYNFLCQIYSSDFPEPYQDAFYLTDGVGYLLINKRLGNDLSDGCFFVQVA